MKLYIKQKVFSWGDKFSVYDSAGNSLYSVHGEVFTLGKKLHVDDTAGNEIAFIHQKIWSFLPKYYISRDGTDIAEVVKEFTVLKARYHVDAFGWEITGNFTGHNYEIKCGERTVAVVSKQWLTWGDTYEISIADDRDEINVLCTVLIIDAVLAAQAASASAATTYSG